MRSTKACMRSMTAMALPLTSKVTHSSSGFISSCRAPSMITPACTKVLAKITMLSAAVKAGDSDSVGVTCVQYER